MTAEFGKEEVGSSFDNFLKEQGIYEEVTESAIKSVLALSTGFLTWITTG